MPAESQGSYTRPTAVAFDEIALPCKWLDKFQARLKCRISMPCTAFSDFQPQIYSHDFTKTQNNTFSIACIPEECIVANVSQIGPNQISDVDGPVIYPMKRWTTDDEVVAEDDALCARITITLDRKTKTVLWVETPNQSDGNLLQKRGQQSTQSNA